MPACQRVPQRRSMPREAELQAQARRLVRRPGRRVEWRPAGFSACAAGCACIAEGACVRAALSCACMVLLPASTRAARRRVRIAIGFIFMVTVVIVTIVVTINIVVAVVIIISIDGCGEYASSPAFRLPVFVMGGGGDGGGRKTGYPLYELQGEFGLSLLSLQFSIDYFHSFLSFGLFFLSFSSQKLLQLFRVSAGVPHEGETCPLDYHCCISRLSSSSVRVRPWASCWAAVSMSSRSRVAGRV